MGFKCGILGLPNVGKSTLPNKPLRIIVIGAGVLGSLYAAKLSKSGSQVSLLARGDRLVQLRRLGVQLEDRLTGERWTGEVKILDKLSADDVFDIAFVLVRRNQLDGVLPVVKSCNAPVVVFLLNNPHAEDLAKAFGDRAVFGFPGAGGMLENGVVRYALIAEQPTTIGEASGQISPRVITLAAVLRRAGLNVSVSSSITSWLKTHAVFVTAVCGALYAARGSAATLAAKPALLNLFIEAAREGFKALHQAGFKVTPFKLRLLFEFMPTWFARSYWQRYFASSLGELVFAAHAKAANDEMVELVRECRLLFPAQGVSEPLERLWREVEGYGAAL
jgi:2-dehydropantoate 2-reductase